MTCPQKFRPITDPVLIGVIGILAPLLSLPGQIGKSSEFPITPLIIGGDRVSSDDYPWMVSLVRRDEPSNYFGQFCGGTVIHPYWVLTAAHCVEDKVALDLDVVLETIDLDSSSFRRMHVVAIVQHPGFFTDFSLEKDVALLQLETPACVPPIRLNDLAQLEEPGILARTIGWGNISPDLENLDFDPILRQVDIPIADRELLNAPEFFDGRLTEDMLPVGFFDPGKSACFGDSGGPLLVRAASISNPLEEEWVQVGIASGTTKCGSDIPDNVYARVFYFQNWIANVVGEDTAAYSPAIYDIASLDTASGYLFSESTPDPSRPENTYYTQDYILTNHPAGQTLTVALESNDIGGRLSIIDRSSGDLLFSDGGNAGRFDASITFTPQAGIQYLFRVSTNNTLESGQFVLHSFPQLANSEITLPQTIAGSLNAQDERFPNSGHLTDVYRLVNVPANRNIEVRLQSQDMDSLIWLFDTGVGEKLDVMDNKGTGVDEVFLFRTGEDKNYDIRVSHFHNDETGPYTLSTNTFTPQTSISLGETLQDFISLDEDEFFDTGEGPPLILDSHEFINSGPTGQTVKVSVTRLGDFYPALGISDVNTFDLFIFDEPNYKGIASLTFFAVSGRRYIIDVIGFQDDDGKNFLLETELIADTVNIPDAALENAIREELGIPTGVITLADMNRLTELFAFLKGIADLTGLEAAQNLTYLDLGSNQISDISPLSGLTGLTQLILSVNQISDLSPLSGLTNLEGRLTLSYNQISDISPLSGLTNLTKLWLDNNQISDISVLNGLTGLTSLDLSQNQISDLGPLNGLNNLQTLDISRNLLILGENSPALAVIENLQNGGTSVTFDSQNLDVFQGQPIDDFPGWRASPWYLNYNTDFWPWIYHDEHGWQFTFTGSAEDTIFLWDLGLSEWIFLNENTYRWVYLFGENAGWIFSFDDNTPQRRFYQRSDDGSLFSPTDELPLNPAASLSFPRAEDATLLLDGPADPHRPGGIFTRKDFRLLNLSPRLPVTMSVDSFDFDCRLQILDGETGEILVDDDNSGPGQGALLTFTPQAGIAYVTRVTNALEEQAGAFLLQVFLPQPITSINTPDQISGNLSLVDAIDFQQLGERYFKDISIP